MANQVGSLKKAETQRLIPELSKRFALGVVDVLVAVIVIVISCARAATIKIRKRLVRGSPR